MSPSRAAWLLLSRLREVDVSFTFYGSGQSALKEYDALAVAARIAKNYDWRAELLLKEKGGRRGR